MTKLALDVGEARIGLAVSQGSLVLPLETFPNTKEGLLSLESELQSRNPDVVYVGLPLNLKGEKTKSTQSALDFAAWVESLGFLVRLIDERLTTRAAQARLHSAGKSTKDSRGYIDAQAAATILEFALESERETYAGKSLGDLNV